MVEASCPSCRSCLSRVISFLLLVQQVFETETEPAVDLNLTPNTTVAKKGVGVSTGEDGHAVGIYLNSRGQLSSARWTTNAKLH